MTENFDWRENQTVPGVAPGTGPVHNADEAFARANIDTLCQDVGLLSYAVRHLPEREDGDGRYCYEVRGPDGRTCDVDMPGLPLYEVRYTGEPGQSILDFPRLYVNGSSWVWSFAVGIMRAVLVETEDEA